MSVTRFVSTYLSVFAWTIGFVSNKINPVLTMILLRTPFQKLTMPLCQIDIGMVKALHSHLPYTVV